MTNKHGDPACVATSVTTLLAALSQKHGGIDRMGKLSYYII